MLQNERGQVKFYPCKSGGRGRTMLKGVKQKVFVWLTWDLEVLEGVRKKFPPFIRGSAKSFTLS